MFAKGFFNSIHVFVCTFEFSSYSFSIKKGLAQKPLHCWRGFVFYATAKAGRNRWTSYPNRARPVIQIARDCVSCRLCAKSV